MNTRHTSSQQTQPVTVQPGDARVIDHLGGERMHILLSSQQTGGTFALFLDEIPAGAGPPLHIHHNEDETFHLLEGTLEIKVNGERQVLSAGASAFLPKGVPHTFRNPDPEKPARALVLVTPSGLEEFFSAVRDLVTQDEPNMNAVMEVAGKYGLEIVGPPLADG